MPVSIESHPDVRRQIMAMVARVEMMRGLLYRTAAYADRARAGVGEDSSLLVEWLLPIVKTLGADVGFAVASGAVQVLGGPGYTRDWPVEQSLRDARVLSIFEGTTGIQAQDLVHRRLLRDKGMTLALVTDLAERALPLCPPNLRGAPSAVFELLRATGKKLLEGGIDRQAIDAGATAFLGLAAEAALTWVGAELAGAGGEDPASRHLRASANTWLAGARARAELRASQVFDGAAETAPFEELVSLG
jgi:hypothetical protein